MATSVNYRRLLGHAFKSWERDTCISMLQTANQGEQYRMAANVAKYVLRMKYNMSDEMINKLKPAKNETETFH